MTDRVLTGTKVPRLTSNKLLVPEIPDDVRPGPGVVDDAPQLHLLLLLHHQLRASLETDELCLSGWHWNEIQIVTLLGRVKTEILTENIELCTGSNWLISSIGTHLALIHSFIRETGVINLKIEHPALV